MARVVTVTANPLLNFTCERTVTAGAVNRVPGLTMVAEGKGVNVARVLAAHGHAVVAMGFAGGATGELLAVGARGYGVEPAFTATAARLRIGFQAGAAEDHHPTTLLEDGFAVTAAEATALLDELDRRLAGTDLVIASGSVPDPGLVGFYAELLTRCAAVDVPCWLDAYGPAMDAALAGPHPPALSKPNRQEYEGGSGWNRVAELHLTDGAAGLLVRDAEGERRLRPPAVTQVNPVGCGDCYLAGLAHARLSGWDAERQWRYAAAAGAANAARADVAAIAPDEIAALTDGVAIETAG